MTCRSCQRPVGESDVMCASCGAFIDRHSIRPEAPTDPAPTDPAPTDPVPTEPLPSASLGVTSTSVLTSCSVVWCTATVPSGAAECGLGHAVGAGRATSPNGLLLILPDLTEITLEEGSSTAIGRGSSDPRIAAALRRFDAVSRHHAVIAVEGGVVRVTHVGLTNPTWVNGQQAAPSVSVAPPADIRLGRNLHLTVRAREGS